VSNFLPFISFYGSMQKTSSFEFNVESCVVGFLRFEIVDAAGNWLNGIVHGLVNGYAFS